MHLAIVAVTKDKLRRGHRIAHTPHCHHYTAGTSGEAPLRSWPLSPPRTLPRRRRDERGDADALAAAVAATVEPKGGCGACRCSRRAAEKQPL